MSPGVSSSAAYCTSARTVPRNPIFFLGLPDICITSAPGVTSLVKPCLRLSLSVAGHVRHVGGLLMACRRCLALPCHPAATQLPPSAVESTTGGKRRLVRRIERLIKLCNHTAACRLHMTMHDLRISPWVLPLGLSMEADQSLLDSEIDILGENILHT